jgi:hypothetical protein
MNKKIILAAAASVLSALILTGCASTDVVLKYSPDSLKKIVDKYPELVTDVTAADGYYSLSADGETALLVSRDYKATGAEDILLETPLQPFIDAGLEPSKLGEGYKAEGGTFYLTADYGSSGKADDFTDALFKSVKAERSALSYHQTLDHYGIGLGKGKFEWAKDYTTNDKDIVFVIKAAPLKDLGVNVNNITGWTFATVQEADGTNVDVLLKAYNLD